MSLENEDRSSRDKATETSAQTQWQAKIAYSREFLLSLSELEICKKLPSGFDESILSDFEDASHSNQDRQRTHGGLPLQGFRRSEYGSSPPTRGDSGNYSRGIYGRWESRSSGRSDRDSDSQSDKDSDSGRRYGNQSQTRRSWQGPEHDGLLGSGSFPRPSGYAAGISAPKVRANDQNQLNRSNEPYHPPRPYKAAPFSRRDTHDSYNDETFGSTECTSEDKVEEERKRRASFELMRKEQHKALQEKQKVNMGKHKADIVSDISTLDDSKEEKGLLDNYDELDVTTTGSVSSIDSGKSVFPSQTPTCRPLVPPGFRNTVLEKNSGPKSLMHSHSAEVQKNETEECFLHPSPVQNGSLSGPERPSSGEINEHYDSKSIPLPVYKKSEQISNSSLNLDMSSERIGMEDYLHQTSILPEAHEERNEPEISEFSSKMSGLKVGGEFKQNDTTSILEKIFGNPLSVSVSKSMDSIQHHDNKLGDAWSPKPVHSSKFARWFLEEERKTGDDLSSSRQNDLLSLIVGNDKGKSRVSEVKALEHFSPEYSHLSSELANKSTTNTSSATNGVSISLHKSSKQELAPAVLTCEDLEQTILSEYSEKSSNLLPPLQGSMVPGAKSERPRAHIDDHASQHLLSLLQKGISPDNTALKIHADVDHVEKPPASDVYNVGIAVRETGEKDGKNVHNYGNSLTLETLFGTAFMKELQSGEAPVSVQRDSAGSAEADNVGPQGLVFPATDNGLFPSEVDQRGFEKTSNAKNFLASNHRQQMTLNEKWLGYDDPQIELNLSKHNPNLASKRSGFDGAVEYQLPEEESLLAVNDDLNPQLSKFLRARNLGQSESLPSKKSGDITEKLAAIGAAIKDERLTIGSDGSAFVRSPYNMTEHDGPFRDLNAQTSSPHFHSMQMSHVRPLLQQLESHPAHINSQLKFMGPERLIQHDASANQQFPASMLRPPFHHPNVGAGFDLPAHRPTLQQMQMSGNYPSHLVNDFPRGAPVPHIGNQATGFMQEVNQMPGYPFGPRQPNIGGLGMPMPAPDISGGGGSNRPEAFQRLIEMELRANSKQIPSFTVGHNSQGMYSNDLEMMRYR